MPSSPPVRKNEVKRPVARPLTIGVFDSGVGGLTVLQALLERMPLHHYLYFGDQAHVPYGPRSLEEIRQFCRAITEWLLSEGAQMIVVACNTASAAALYTLRQAYSEIPFVGMEPAVKPAVEQTRKGCIGILATPATFQGSLYTATRARYADNVQVIESTCPGLVALIESGEFSSEATRSLLSRCLQPMITQGVDEVVLGCTHYPLVLPLIQQIVGDQVKVINPAPAVARQAERLAAGIVPVQMRPGGESALRLYTSGEVQGLETIACQVIKEPWRVERLHWEGDQLFGSSSTRPDLCSGARNSPILK